MAKGKYQYWLTDDGLLRIQGWARDGLTDEQIAKEMHISRSTLAEWRKRYPDIAAQENFKHSEAGAFFVFKNG